MRIPRLREVTPHITTISATLRHSFLPLFFLLLPFTLAPKTTQNLVQSLVFQKKKQAGRGKELAKDYRLLSQPSDCTVPSPRCP